MSSRQGRCPEIHLQIKRIEPCNRDQRVKHRPNIAAVQRKLRDMFLLESWKALVANRFQIEAEQKEEAYQKALKRKQYEWEPSDDTGYGQFVLLSEEETERDSPW